ncbi:MAG: hypothetical protein H7A46_21960 [Verrucomicrobiales bacterium]|nr:hypothetical protein [Verrucomicrobiales bacterium]
MKQFRLLGQIFAHGLLRKRADLALRQSEERVGLAMAAADTGLWTLKAGDTRFWCTPNILAMSGLPPADGIEVNQFLGLVHPDDRALVQAAIEGALQNDEMQVIERSQAIALTFTTPATVPTPAAAVPVPTTAPVPAAAPIAAAAPAPAPIPAPVPRQVTLPSGTLLLVRIKDGISSKNAAGTPFATKLEYDLYSSGAKVIPAKKTARFFQLENQLNAALDLRVAASLPLIK